jgi:hypothetical protein
MEISRNSEEKVQILSGEGDQSSSDTHDHDLENQKDVLIPASKKNYSLSSLLS